jgi:hypothetical protein
MKKTLLAAAAAVAIFGTPALAADSMMKASTEATMLCRPAAKGEKPDAMMGTKGIVCKSMDKMMAAGGHMGPDTKAMDKAATDKAWQEWLDHAMLIPASLGSGAGG